MAIAISLERKDDMSAPAGMGAHLDLAYVDLAVLLAQLLVRLRHGVERHHGIAQILRGECGALDVESLLGELRQLRLVHALLLECPHSALLNRFLHFWLLASIPRGEERSHLARSITQLAHLLFVACKLSIEFLYLDFDSG
jgi:hypothetical protein